jgi:hypothetical protein
MTTQNINKYSVVTPDSSSIDKNPVDLRPKGKDADKIAVSPDPKTLRDSLEAKRQLINLLEKGGYIKEQDFGQIKADMNRAIADLDSIIRLFNK